MNKTLLIYDISVKKVRDLILDEKITKNDTLAINRDDFDELALSYRIEYNEPLILPFKLLHVNITICDRLKTNEVRIDRGSSYAEHTGNSMSEIFQVYRCGYCGNIVDADGCLLSESERSKIIYYIANSEHIIDQIKITGDCCRNKNY